VIVDDVYTRGTNLGKVATLCANNGLIVSGGVVVFDRSGLCVPSFINGEHNSAVHSLLQRGIATH